MDGMGCKLFLMLDAKALPGPTAVVSFLTKSLEFQPEIETGKCSALCVYGGSFSLCVHLLYTACESEWRGSGNQSPQT